MENPVNSLINFIPEKWRGTVMVLILVSPYVTRAYHAIAAGGGIRGVFSAIWLGTNTPKQDPNPKTPPPSPP